jgi:hypothetical protein
MARDNTDMPLLRGARVEPRYRHKTQEFTTVADAE